ncbi:MAG: hypothetical protein H7125_02895 [Proteobacteria bacterium]|nr:hypothetical protein [Burkholderiales bacterium]
MSDAPFPTLFNLDQIERSIPYDPTVDTPVAKPVPIDPDPRHALERQFPHVLARIIGLWGSPMCCEYLQSLMVMDRGEVRQGFPIELIEDLIMLDYCHNYRPGLPPALK